MQSHYLKNVSRKLRNNPTEAEYRLWQYLKRKQIKNLQFYRQKPIGRYIADFYCPAGKLVVEVDGGQHYNGEEIIQEDKIRENYLKNVLKLKVLRFTNIDILQNITAVIDKINESL